MKRTALLLSFIAIVALCGCEIATPTVETPTRGAPVHNRTRLSIGEVAQPTMVAHFIDVGQGDATLLEFSRGAILIDSGGDKEHSANLVPYLKLFFKSRPDLKNTLEVVFITHPHIDHTIAVTELKKDFHVKQWVMNGIRSGPGWSEKGWPPVKWLTTDTKCPHGKPIRLREVKDDEIVALDDEREGKPSYKTGLWDSEIDPINYDDCNPRIVVLGGGMMELYEGWSKKDFDNGNNHSLVIRVDFGESSFLFTGDLETTAIGTLLSYYDGKKAKILDVDVYQVGHHGSHNATTEELMRAMAPDVSIISMSAYDYRHTFTGWAHGHPNRCIVGLLEQETRLKRDKPVTRVAFCRGHSKSKPDADRTHRPTITKKVFATGWEGNIKVIAELKEGSLKVIPQKPNEN